MLRKVFVLIAVFFILRCVVWGVPQYRYSNPASSSSNMCRSNLGIGICKYFADCEPYMKGELSFGNLSQCGSKALNYCCPIRFESKSEMVSSTTTRIDVPINNRKLKEGSSCQSKFGSGICRNPQECEPLISRKMLYGELSRCKYTARYEVLCCPDAPKKPRPSVIACQEYKAVNPSWISFHIIDGVEASPGEFPHMGAMLYKSEKAGEEYTFNCGASLIAPRFALTAAHCVINAWPEIVRFGSVEWNPMENKTYRKDAKVKNVTIHEDYVPSKVYHDIALIEFTENVTTTLKVNFACLYTKMEDIAESENLQVAGWGLTSANVYSSVLMKANLTTYPLEKCKNEMQLASSRFDIGIIDGQYCTLDPTNGKKKDACRGDSGGPLMVETNDCFQIIGIVSFGEGCASDIPSIYTRVAYYLDWIEEIVWPHLKN